MSSTCHTFSCGHVFQLLVPPANQKRRALPSGPGLRARTRDVSVLSVKATPPTTEHGSVFDKLPVFGVFFGGVVAAPVEALRSTITSDAVDKKSTAADGSQQLPFYASEQPGEGRRVSCVVPWTSEFPGM